MQCRRRVHARGILVRLQEQETRARSNAFYSAAMQQLVAEESGTDYGMAAPAGTEATPP